MKKRIILTCGLLAVLSLSGCVSALVGSDAYAKLTPEQIKQMKDLQMDVYACASIAGPPPTGRVITIYVPRLDKRPDVKFGPDCQIMP